MILLDEVEKAHSDVFNIMLQVFDDGRLTDGHGRTVDFRNSVVIMTSNLGSDLIGQMTEQSDHAQTQSLILDVVKRNFRPEFVNRIDDIVVFNSLSKRNVEQIADIQIKHLAERLENRDLSVQIDQSAMHKLADAGFDPVYGARPLKRAIQTNIENPLAKQNSFRQILQW